MPSACVKCGSPTTNPKHCANCQVERAGATTDGQEYECPSCGGPVSGPGVDCYKCRGDGR